ncbi:MAG: hypothetical protein AAFR87_00485 [Bacteroidota bacterium]
MRAEAPLLHRVRGTDSAAGLQQLDLFLLFHLREKKKRTSKEKKKKSHKNPLFFI